MPRKKSPTLTEAELRLMQVLWDRDPATVGEVSKALPRRLNLAYNTVLTTLRILEQKGYLKRTKRGRAHVYAPAVDRHSARRSALKHIISRFFDGSPELLMQNLLEDDHLNPDELAHLRQLLAGQNEGEQ